MIFYSWAWIPAIIIFSIIILVFLESDREGSATFTFIFGAVVINYIFRWQALYWIRDHLGQFAILILAYFAMGIVWSFIKWYFFLLNIRDEVRAAGGSEAWKKQRDTRVWKSSKVPPDPAEHKERIIGWMTYWPWSAVWTIINDPIKRLWKMIFARFAGLFKGISERMFSGV